MQGDTSHPDAPRLTPTAATTREQPSPDASVSCLIALGLGCYLGWQTIDISPTLFPAPAAGVQVAIADWAYAGTALLLVLLAGLALLAWRRGPLLGRTWLIAIAALGPSAGTALLYLSGWASDPPIMAGVAVGRVLFGTSAALVVLWGELLCRVRSTHVLACVAAGYGISFGFCLIEANLDPAAALTFRPILPLLSGAILLVLHHDLTPTITKAELPTGMHKPQGSSVPPASQAHIASPVARDEECDAAHPRHHGTARRPPIPIFVGTGLFGIIFVATNHLSETKTEVSTELYTLIAGVAVSVALVLIAVAARGMYENFSLLYRLVTPLVIGCLLLTLTLQPGRQYYEALAIGLTWALFRIFTWTLWARMGARDPRRGACVFALGQIFLTICSTIGEFACTVVDLSTVPLAVAASAIILAAVFTSAFVMNEGSVARLLATRGTGVTGASARNQDATGNLGDGIPAEGAVDVESVTLSQLTRVTEALGLSEREREIALLVLKRHDNGHICQQACITESTLRTHLRNIYGKTDTHSRGELVKLLERCLVNERS